MTVYYTLKPSHIDALHRLYQQTWWTSGRTRQQTQKLVAHSQITIAMEEAGRLLAFVRVLTDYTTKALIFDLIVCKEAQGRGLGREMLSLVLSHEALQEVMHFELYCAPEMVAYYERLGFSDMTKQLSLMRQEMASK